MNMRLAAKIKLGLAAAHGDTVSLAGRIHRVFPSPERLLEVEAFPGLSAEKVARLHGVARAAIEGKLDAYRLRALGEDAAIAELQQIRGVGPWTAARVYFRGAAHRTGCRSPSRASSMGSRTRSGRSPPVRRLPRPPSAGGPTGCGCASCCPDT